MTSTQSLGRFHFSGLSAGTVDNPITVLADAAVVTSPVTETFVATAAQTNFTLASAPAIAYVYIEDVAQDPADYSISGSDVVLDTGATLSDNVRIVYVTSRADANVVSLAVQNFGTEAFLARLNDGTQQTDWVRVIKGQDAALKLTTLVDTNLELARPISGAPRFISAGDVGQAASHLPLIGGVRTL